MNGGEIRSKRSAGALCLVMLCIHACTISSPFSTLSISQDCQNKLEELRDSWRRVAKTNRFQIDTSLVLSASEIRGCNQQISTSVFTDIFGAPTSQQMADRGGKMVYHIGDQKSLSGILEAHFIKDRLFSMNVYDCAGATELLANGLRYDTVNNHFRTSLSFRDMARLYYCTQGTDTSTFVELFGNPSYRDNAVRTWHYFLQAQPGANPEPVMFNRIQIEFDSAWRSVVISEEMGMSVSH